MRRNLLFATFVLGLVLAGCGGKDADKTNPIKIISQSPTLQNGDEFQIEATSELDITYSSENEYHAKVSATGLVTAYRVGQTNIVLTNGEDTQRLRVSVAPKSRLYPEPDLKFGMTRAEVKSKMGAADSETDSSLLYENYSPNAPIHICLFDESDKLDGYSVMVSTEYSGELGQFLGERYAVVGYLEGSYTFGFVNGLSEKTITMGVGARLYNQSYWMVMYFPFTLTTTKANSAVDHSVLMNRIDEVMAAR